MSNPESLHDWLVLLEGRHVKTIDLGLERCGEVYRRLGSPRPATTVFTVAGTNGKGSTVAYLSAFAAACGQRFGSYTSPHIISFNERICVMGEPVPDQAIIKAFERIEQVRGDISLSYFEFTTLAGFLILAEAKLDTAILEVGLGGRLDTVNLIDADCAVITPIGLDHQEYLGHDIETIAKEKAGVIRTGSPVVCSQGNPPSAILTTATELLAPVFRRDHDFSLGRDHKNGQELRLEFNMLGQRLQLRPPLLGGEHQLDNLAAALAAFALLNPAFVNHEEAISDAIAACRLPGRMQCVSESPPVFVDVGHNPLAARAVARFLSDNGHTDVVCVLAMLADKDAESVVAELKAVCSDWVCADSDGQRGQSGERLAQRIKTLVPVERVHISSSMEAAMDKALEQSQEIRTILVFGSFTTVAAFIEWKQARLEAKLA